MTRPGDIDRLLDRWPAPHLGCALVGPGGVVGAWGDVGRPFDLASVTKVLVSMGCWVAFEEGAMSVDAPAGPPGSTIRHLLSHASGLPNEGSEPIAAPATRRVYSNTGFEVLAAALEASTGMTWQDYVSAAVCEPLGLAATSFGPSAARSGRSTVTDLTVLCSELLSPTLVSVTTVAAASSNQFGDLPGIVPGFGPQDPCPWGLGVEIRGNKSPHWTGHTNSVGTFGHFGASGTFCWVDPDRDLAAIGLGDVDFGPWAVDLWPALSDALLGLG